MNELLVYIIDRVKYSGKPLKKSSTYLPLVSKALENLSGQNSGGQTVSGADFWKIAKEGGAAGAFSSSAGKKILVSRLVSGMPEFKID